MDIFMIFVITFVILLSLKKKRFFKKKAINKEAIVADTEFMYLKSLYKVDINKLDYFKAITAISFVNALCISFSYVVYGLFEFENFILKLLIMFLIIVVIVIIGYYVLSVFLKRKCYR